MVLTSETPTPTAVHVNCTLRVEGTSKVKLNVEQGSILIGPFPLEIPGADGTDGLPTAQRVDAENAERVFADLILFCASATSSQGRMVGLVPKMTLRIELVSQTHSLPEPTPVSISTALQGNLPT